MKTSLFRPLLLDHYECYCLHFSYPEGEFTTNVKTSFELIHDPRKCDRKVYKLPASKRDIGYPRLGGYPICFPKNWTEFSNSYTDVSYIHFVANIPPIECDCLVALIVEGYSNVEAFRETIFLKIDYYLIG